MKNWIWFFAALLSSGSGLAQSAHTSTWIWYPDDYEIWLHKEVSLRRIQRNHIFPPFYRLDTHYGNIKFIKDVDLTTPEAIYIKATGIFSVQKNWDFLPDKKGWVTLPKGQYRLSVNVINYDSLPSVFIKGTSIFSDSSWRVTCYNDQEVPVSYAGFNAVDQSPLHFPFHYQEIRPVRVEQEGNGFLLDFGKETFGYLKLKQIHGAGRVNIYYGESREEALSNEYAEIHDSITILKDSSLSYTLNHSRGLRYIRIVPSDTVKIGSCSFLYEYLPEQIRGSFRCSNKQLNKIWEVAAYTLELTTREFMLDGIKRDRWVWGGDARQSFLMNYYLFFDKDVNRRTLIALRGKDPIEIHINHIPDYSLYWLISLYEYYLYTGDKQLIEQLYPKMVTMMDFCATRLDGDRFFVGRPGDNMFLDWANIDKSGELSAYQLLYARSLEAFSKCAELVHDEKNALKYQAMAADLKKRTLDLFWNDRLQALVNNRINERQVKSVNRYANMFGVLFNDFNEEKKELVKNFVLTNDSIPKITTPYMRFYELAALCELGEHSYVTKQILEYWGGMLHLGATTFWEVYDPSQKGAQHYAMYGHPFEKSLCHAWGASPLFILGKYYLGVQPLSPGYASFEVRPHLGGLKWIEGTVPTPKGDVHVFMDQKTIQVTAPVAGGVLTFSSKTRPRANGGAIRSLGNQQHQLDLLPEKSIAVDYQSAEPVLHLNDNKQ